MDDLLKGIREAIDRCEKFDDALDELLEQTRTTTIKEVLGEVRKVILKVDYDYDDPHEHPSAGLYLEALDQLEQRLTDAQEKEEGK